MPASTATAAACCRESGAYTAPVVSHQAMQPSHRQEAPLYWPWVDLFTMGLKCLICRLPLGNDPITRNHRDAWLRQLRH